VTFLADTNVIVRLIVNDDTEQVRRALSMLDKDGFEISLTVLLECVWLLASRYRFQREGILAALQALERTQGISFSDAAAANAAIGAYAGGMDIADAIHLSQASDDKRLATFDGDLAAVAGGIGLFRAVQLI
jgi:predicted nucleic acid-binding protein